MRRIQISAVSMKTTPLDFEGNYQTILSVLNSPKVKESSIIVFPECCISGYSCEDAFLYSHTCDLSFSYLKKLLPFSKNRLLAVGLPLMISPYLYNVCALLYDGEILAFIPKNYLANRSVFYENRWFSTTNQFKKLNYDNILFGNYIFNFLDTKIGIQICADLWENSPEQIDMFEKGTEIILSLNASPFEMGKQKSRIELLKQKSRNYNCIIAYSNLNGNEAGNLIFDGGACIVADGEFFGQTKRIHLEDFQITTAIFDLKLLTQNRIKNSTQFFISSDLKRVEDFDIKQFLGKDNLTPTKQINLKEEDIYNDFTKAVCLGLWDYLVKSKTKGFTLSLSGGVDSAVCAILVFTMKNLVLQTLGKQVFQDYKLNEKEILQTVYQKTKNNSELTQKIASNLSKEINALYYQVEIDEEVQSISEKFQNATNISLNWKDHNISLQNIQARVRSPIIWMFANIKNHLLISTSNRSEASVGYCTMDGDTSGSISPIGGVSKKFLLDFLNHIQKGKNIYIKPLKSVDLLLSTKPTAELKPINEKQEDEKDLMPYDILNRIETEFVQNGKTKEEILDSIEFKDKKELKKYIDKYFLLFQSNQWKRNRTAATFHLDNYDLDMKSNFRFPIFSGKW